MILGEVLRDDDGFVIASTLGGLQLCQYEELAEAAGLQGQDHRKEVK